MNPLIDALELRDLLGLVDEVCRQRRVTRDELCGRARTKAISAARKELWWRLRHHPDMSFSFQEIGRLFGRHHATVIQGIRAHARCLSDGAFHARGAEAERAPSAAADRAR